MSYLTQRERPGETSPRVDSVAAATMSNALLQVAGLNNLDPRRHNFRHGSINWRRGKVESLVGHSVESLPIDIRVRRLNALMLALFLIFLGLSAWAG
ncbi:MAG: hypothetical protein GC164_01365 [Phycisphaera sp.]|nr:hypothetical protein [Phycisphaera sp.]